MIRMKPQWVGFIVLMALCLSCDFRYGKQRIESLGSETVDQGSVLDAINLELESNPNDGFLLKRKVNFLENSDWPDGSLDALNKALVVLPEDGEVHYQAALFFHSRDQLELAIAELVQAGNLGYLTSDYFLTYAQVLLKSGNVQAAFDQINRFQELDPNNYRSYYLKGSIFLERGDTALAVAALNNAFRMERDDDDLNLQLIDLYLALYDTANYVRVIDQVTRNDEGWLLKIALLKESYGLTNEAILDYKTIIAKNPDFLPAYLYLTRSYYQVGQLDSTILYSQQITQRDSLNLQARLIRARSYDRKYQYSAAIDEYQALISIDSTYDNAQEELISVYRKVAYLRRLREEKESIPEFNFAPIKKNEVNGNN